MPTQQPATPGAPILPGASGAEGVQARPLPTGPSLGVSQQVIPPATTQPVSQAPQQQPGQVRPANAPGFDSNAAPQMSEEGPPF